MNTRTIDYDALAERRQAIHIPMRLVPVYRIYDERNRGHQWESEVVVRGRFRHQGRAWSFTVMYGDAEQWTRVRDGGDMVQLERAYLVAQADVLQSARYGDTAQVPVVEVRDGDVLEVCGRRLQIRDNVAFQNPQLYPTV